MTEHDPTSVLGQTTQVPLVDATLEPARTRDIARVLAEYEGLRDSSTDAKFDARAVAAYMVVAAVELQRITRTLLTMRRRGMIAQAEELSAGLATTTALFAAFAADLEDPNHPTVAYLLESPLERFPLDTEN